MTRTEAISCGPSAKSWRPSARRLLDRADDLDMLVIKVPFRRGHLVPRAVRISTETETVLGKVR